MKKINTLFYLNSLAPAAGMEQVVSSHAYFFTKISKVTILTKDSRKSFFQLPDSAKILSLNINIELNMKCRFIRIMQVLYGVIYSSAKLNDRIKLLKPEFIYVPSPINLLEVLISTGRISNVIVTEHASFVSYNLFYKLIVRLLYPRTALIVSPTNSDTNFYKSIGCPAAFIPNPLAFYPDKLSTDRSKLALHVGRLVDDKDQSALIRIWKVISVKHPDWRLRIIGTGENYGALKNLILEYGLSKCVEILSPTNKLIDHYLEASFFLLSSKSEGFGMVLIEAMSCGLPCIAFDCPVGPREIIQHGENGFLVEIGNINNFADRINDLISNKALRIKLGCNARLSSFPYSKDLIFRKWNILLKNL